MSQRRQIKQQKKSKKELQHDQQRASTHQQQLGQLHNDDGTLRQQYVESLTRSELDPSTIRLLQNYLTRDYVLGNLKEAEIHEMKWLLEADKVEIFAMHPRQGSSMTGARRAWMLEEDEEWAALSPLTEQERKDIENVLRGVYTRIARSRGGWQQEEMSKVTSVSEVHDKRESKKDGLLSGLR